MIKGILYSILAALVLNGCKKNISCTSDETQALFVNSFNSRLQGYNTDVSWVESNAKISLANIQTISSDNQSNSYACKADVKVEVSNLNSNSLLSLLLSNKISIDDAITRLISNNYFNDTSSQSDLSAAFSMIGSEVGALFSLSEFKANSNITANGYTSNVYFNINLSNDYKTQIINVKNIDSIVYPSVMLESLNFAKSTTTLTGQLTLEENDGQESGMNLSQYHYPGYFLRNPNKPDGTYYFIGLYGNKDVESKVDIIREKSGCEIYTLEDMSLPSYRNTPDCSIEAIGSPDDDSVITQIISAKKLN
jgi:hypothetical protein